MEDWVKAVVDDVNLYLTIIIGLITIIPALGAGIIYLWHKFQKSVTKKAEEINQDLTLKLDAVTKELQETREIQKNTGTEVKTLNELMNKHLAASDKHAALLDMRLDELEEDDPMWRAGRDRDRRGRSRDRRHSN